MSGVIYQCCYWIAGRSEKIKKVGMEAMSVQ